MKKFVRIICALITIVCIACMFVACTDRPDISYGSYIAENNDDSYIVLSKDTVSFHNIDFSGFDEDVFNYGGLSVNTAEILVGEQPYDISDNKDKIFVHVIDNYCLTLRYGNADKTLSIGEEKFILQKS